MYQHTQTAELCRACHTTKMKIDNVTNGLNTIPLKDAITTYKLCRSREGGWLPTAVKSGTSRYKRTVNSSSKP